MNSRVLFFVLILCGISFGADINFFSNGQINAGDNWDDAGIWHDNTIVDMLGGTVKNLSAYDKSIVNIYSGQITGSNNRAYFERGVGAFGHSTVNIIGGHIFGAGAMDFSVLNIKGGDIGFLRTSPNSKINVYGKQLSITNTGGSFGFGKVTGVWSDDQSFDISIYDNTYNNIVLHEIPEPASVVLLLTGTLLVLRKQYA